MIKKIVIANLISYAIAGVISLAMVPVSMAVGESFVRRLTKE